MNDQNTILVTGGAGYIGSHVCKALAAGGFHPVSYDNLSRGHDWAVKWGPLEKGEMNDGERLTAVLSQYRPRGVIHLAALACVKESVENPLLYYENTINGTLTLLKAMHETGIGYIVFSSSCSVYGNPEISPIKESEPTKPQNPYGFTKLAAERMLADCDAAFGLRSISLRYFNAAGADPEGETGEVHDPETHLIPLVLDTASGRRERIVIFGDDYETEDGTCVRDYIHVSDLAQAHVSALKKIISGAKTQALNLGNGSGFSVRQVIDMASKVTGGTINVEIGARRAGDPPLLIGDASLARDILGWEPQYSSLEEQISHAWKWHQRYHQD